MRNLLFVLSFTILILNSACCKQKQLDEVILTQLEDTVLLPFFVSWDVGCDGRTTFCLELTKKGEKFQAIEITTDNYSEVYKSDTLRVDSLSEKQIELCKNFLVGAIHMKDSCPSETTANPITYIIINKHYLKQIYYCEWDNDYGNFRYELFKTKQEKL